jgi:hypothetical protein
MGIKGEVMSIPKVVITVEGGLIQCIDSEVPLDVAVLDFDIDGADSEELTEYEDTGGHITNAFLSSWGVSGDKVIVDHVFKQLKE